MAVDSQTILAVLAAGSQICRKDKNKMPCGEI